MKRIIYHGTPKEFDMPQFGLGNKNNDYGIGFYCTEDFNLASEWSCRYSTFGFVNVYSIEEKDLKILDLAKNEYGLLNWLALLLNNRDIGDSYKEEYKEELAFINKYLIDLSPYDIIIGWRADDAYYRFPKLFFENLLTYEALEEIFHLGNLGTQYVLISPKAFSHLAFIKRKEAAFNSKKSYELRMSEASSKLDKIIKNDRRKVSPRLRDLVIKDA